MVVQRHGGRYLNVQGTVPRDETPLSDVPEPTDKPVHDYLLRLREAPDAAAIHPTEVAIRLRDYIESLPAHQATFTLPKFAKAHDDIDPAVIQTPMVHLTGAWKAGTVYHSPGTQCPDRWVNPSHPHKARYSDAIVNCECGTIAVHDQSAGSRQHALPHDDFDNHTDACLKQWRFQARADVLCRRATVLEEMLATGHSGAACFPRLGLTDQGTISRLATAVGVDVANLKAEYMAKRKHTMHELLVLFSPAEIGRVYGVSSGTVYGTLGEFDIDHEAFHTIRETNRQPPQQSRAASPGVMAHGD